MPDYYRGEMLDPSTEGADVPGFIKKKTVWRSLDEDWKQKVQPFAEKKGAQVYGTVGKEKKTFDFHCCVCDWSFIFSDQKTHNFAKKVLSEGAVEILFEVFYTF